MAAISNVYGVGGTPLPPADKPKTHEEASNLDKDAFLRILITQLSHQDPLSPLEDKDFIAQMAQFSSLEQMANMAKSMDAMKNFSMLGSVNFIGRTVDYVDEDSGQQASSKVVGVEFDEGVVVLNLENKSQINLQHVVGVA